MGKPCVVGCTGLSVDAVRRKAQLGGTTINEGDWLSIDGGSGAIYCGRGKVVVDRPEADLVQIERWRNHSLEHQD
jgi:pyruvate,orthophosphate dikinase